MQYNAIRTLAQQNWMQSIGWKVFRWILWLSVVVYCVYRWQTGISTEVESYISGIRTNGRLPLVILGVALAMPLNWYLETIRWQMLLKEQNLDFKEAWRGVWMGLVLGLWLPRLVGDYLGRVGELPVKKRRTGISQAFLGQATLMASTLSAGVFGVILYLGGGFHLAIVSVMGALILVPFLVWFALTYMPMYVRRFYPAATKLSLSPSLFVQLQGLSHFRYGVFMLQYFLLLQLFLPELPTYVIFGGITWVYLAKSITPFLHVFGDLGVREFSALLYFDTWDISAVPVMAPTIILWVINVMVPAFFGTLVWVRFKTKPS